MKLSQSVDCRLQGRGGSDQSTVLNNSDQRDATLAGSEPPPQQQQQLNKNGNSKPKVEDTVNMITNRLRERRGELGLPESLEVGVAEILLRSAVMLLFDGPLTPVESD